MLGKPLPEVTVVVTVCALLFIPNWAPWLDASVLGIAIMTDVATILMSATWVDVATKVAPRATVVVQRPDCRRDAGVAHIKSLT